MTNYIKKELDTFEFDKRYPTLIEHRWCFMKDDEKFDEYNKKREDFFKPKRGRVQSDLELTGQIGPYTGSLPWDKEDSDEDSGDSENEPEKSGQPNNEIWYTTTDKTTIPNPTREQWSMEDFGANLVSNTYEGEYGILKFDNDIQYIRSNFWEYDSYGLETISIPASVTNIDQNGGFHRCPMKSITFLSQTPPVVRDEVFDAMYDELVIYVPAESVDTYKNAEGWEEYSDRIQAIVSNS